MHHIIENVPGNGRTLRRFILPELTEAEKVLAENAALDPESPDEMFEPFASPGLFSRVRKLHSPG
jgi:hypothetical protein